MNVSDRTIFQPGAGGAPALDQAGPTRSSRSAFHLPSKPFHLITPREPAQRGNQLSILLEKDAKAVTEAFWARGVVSDERPPNLIRVAPAPLYNTYHEVWTFVRHLRDILTGEKVIYEPDP